jgi:hypothetical protein
MNLSIYEFTEEDLKSNQRGFISPGQKAMIAGMAGGIRRVQKWNVKIALIFPFIGLCMVLGLSLSNEDARAAFFASPLNLIVLILLIPLILGIFALSIYFANKRADRLENSELSVVEGKVRLDESHSSKVGPTYYAILGKTKFAFPEDVSGIFQEGGKYRIYYCQTSMLKLILSYEMIL